MDLIGYPLRRIRRNVYTTGMPRAVRRAFGRTTLGDLDWTRSTMVDLRNTRWMFVRWGVRKSVPCGDGARPCSSNSVRSSEDKLFLRIFRGLGHDGQKYRRRPSRHSDIVACCDNCSLQLQQWGDSPSISNGSSSSESLHSPSLLQPLESMEETKACVNVGDDLGDARFPRRPLGPTSAQPLTWIDDGQDGLVLLSSLDQVLRSSDFVLELGNSCRRPEHGAPFLLRCCIMHNRDIGNQKRFQIQRNS